MQWVAPGIGLLHTFPRFVLNVYLIEDVLVDAATRWHCRQLLPQLAQRPPRLVVLTHAHPDHQGIARVVCRRFRVPLACHRADAAAMEGRSALVPGHRVVNVLGKLIAGLPHPVSRVLADGDDLAGFRVIHAPGHTPGHVIFFREADRVALAGDLLANLNFRTGREGLVEPPWFFSLDPEQNRQSIRLLWSLQPKLVCFGHGPPLRDMGRLERFVHAMNNRTGQDARSA
jgi:glyoxylase-like metal-dependent hydrolase (beta-lactamase superfamily II)